MRLALNHCSVFQCSFVVLDPDFVPVRPRTKLSRLPKNVSRSLNFHQAQGNRLTDFVCHQLGKRLALKL
jgi:hypothetical protein